MVSLIFFVFDYGGNVFTSEVTGKTAVFAYLGQGSLLYLAESLGPYHGQNLARRREAQVVYSNVVGANLHNTGEVAGAAELNGKFTVFKHVCAV